MHLLPQLVISHRSYANWGPTPSQSSPQQLCVCLVPKPVLKTSVLAEALGSLLHTQVSVTHPFIFQASLCCKIVGCFLLQDNLVQQKESPCSHLKFLYVMKRNTWMCVLMLWIPWGHQKGQFSSLSCGTCRISGQL